MHVLVVEDDPVSAKIVSKRLEYLGHTSEVVGDGEAAWARYQTSKDLDVIVSGWFQPGVTGAELCRRVREDDGHYTSFLFATGADERRFQIEGMKAGADGYLTKPIDMHELNMCLISAERTAALHRKIEAQAAELTRLSAMFYAQGRRDALTGIANRLQLEEDAHAAHERAATLGIGYSLAMVDIDQFKSYNDGYGHVAGDEALRQVAETLSRCVRGADRVYRYGGEEFAVLIQTHSADVAEQVVERMRLAVERLDIAHGHGRDRITISAGVTTVSAQATAPLQDIFERADTALYTAKAKGRNRVIRYRPELGAEPQLEQTPA